MTGHLKQTSLTRIRATPTAEQAADVDQLLGSLPERERAIVYLRFQQELTQREIGALLGISQMPVSRSLQRLRERIETGASAHAPSASRRPTGVLSSQAINRRQWSIDST